MLPEATFGWVVGSGDSICILRERRKFLAEGVGGFAPKKQPAPQFKSNDMEPENSVLHEICHDLVSITPYSLLATETTILAPRAALTRAGRSWS